MAARTGMAVTYLGYLEEHPGAAPGPGPLTRPAQALQTTVTELTPDECRALLGSHGVGRLVVPTDTGPVIVPVNYSFAEGAFVFRTALGATPSLAAGQAVALEVDGIDDTFSQGWSVLIRGSARSVTDPQEQRRFTGQAYSAPWAACVTCGCVSNPAR
ncbi:pyridoxamine 5'-phosphate oxidase family protein [Streptomyces sp. NPDC001153]